MPAADALITRDGPVPAPLDYVVPGVESIEPVVVTASFDGSGAASSFLPTLEVIAPTGAVVARCPIGSSVAAGGSADVTWFPGVSETSKSGGLPIIGFSAFTPAGNQVSIASTDPNNPTTIISLPSVTLDGATTVQFQFYASAIDLDQRGQTGLGGVLLELYRGSNAIGVVGDWNANPGDYFVTTLFVAGVDAPAAGSYVYSIRGWRQVSGGTGPGASNVYGTGLATPHATRAGYMLLLNATS